MIQTFLLSSRLGLLRQPNGQSELNIGVEEAPQVVITSTLQSELDMETTEVTFTIPDGLTQEEYLERFARETQAAAAEMRSKINTTSTPVSVAVGGDHSVSLGHVAALLQTVADPSKTGVLMIDSHADINLLSSSPTGNTHGMWLRPIISSFDHAEIDSIIPTKIAQQNLKYIGNLDLDPAEREFVETQGITRFSVEEMRARKADVLKELEAWISSLQHLHLSIDVDAFDKSLTPATGIPCENGLLFEDVAEVLQLVKNLPQWSLDIVEVNPRKDGAEKTIAFAQKLLRTLLT